MDTAFFRPIRRFIFIAMAIAALLPFTALAQTTAGVTKFPEAYVKLMQAAARAFYGRDFDQALDLLSKAEEIVPQTATTLNIRGAIAIERKEFELGTRYCEEALKLDPKYFAALFNLGEIPFMQKKYPEARAIYQSIPDGETKNELKEYRIYLTYLLSGDDTKAAELLTKFKFPANTGAYYYAHAAWDYNHGEKDKAMQWVRSGNWVFSLERNIDFAGVFFDLGWIERPKMSAKRSDEAKIDASAPEKPTTPAADEKPAP